MQFFFKFKFFYVIYVPKVAYIISIRFYFHIFLHLGSRGLTWVLEKSSLSFGRPWPRA